MTNFYKSLIVITALISLFFFGKWAYKVWPRYEVRETIAPFTYKYMNFILRSSNCDDKKEDNKNILACFCERGRMVDEDKWQEKSSWEWEWRGNCYIKEKVRIN